MSIVVVGGGLAGLATAVALGSAGHNVTVLEARPHLGGRATSYPLNNSEDEATTIDNCQHVLLRCCTNLLDFYRRLGVENRVRFYREFYWIEPGGRTSILRRGLLPAPLHFTESFLKLRFLSLADKLAVASGLLAIRYEYGKRTDLDSISMLDWLREKNQTPRAIERFWRQVLVSAINEDLERMAASHGLQVFYLGFLSRPDSYEMGVPAVPLAELYSQQAWSTYPDVRIEQRAAVRELSLEGDRAASVVLNDGSAQHADAYVVAVPFERVNAVVPGLNLDLTAFSHAPITGIHLWFDRAVTDLPHATLLDRTIQWMFNKQDGRYIQLVVSASRSMTEMSRGDVIDLAVRELKEFFPRVAAAKIERAHVVKEVRATFSACPGLEQRPLARTAISNLFLAGDWTRSGWPATMEGAVRSGYLAAEAVSEFLGAPKKFLKPELI